LYFLGRSHLATDATKAQHREAEVPHEQVSGSDFNSKAMVKLKTYILLND
jgi:hypothetical protein